MIELGLQRISRLLAHTPLPWRAIHVAGTNGKGSICHQISHMLEAYNTSDFRIASGRRRLKHARFTSPHLVDRWDCIAISQQTVQASLFHQIEGDVLKRNAVQDIGASEFELLTATAFEIFTAEEVDVAVIEVGMGGRLDATNILGQPSPTGVSRAKPLVTAVAKIGLDHQDFLGDTLEKIAREKAGIFKPGVPVVYDVSNDDVVKAVLEEAAAGNRVVNLQDTEMVIDSLEPAIRHNLLALDTGGGDANVVSPLDIPLHTLQNLSVSFRSAWTSLQRLGCIPTQMLNAKQGDEQALTSLSNQMVDAALHHKKYDGRLQTIDIEGLTGRPEPVLLDGAHNAQSAEVLGDAVRRQRQEAEANGRSRNVSWILAMSSSKATEDILRPLLENNDTVFAVEFAPVDGMPWVKPKSDAEITTIVRQIFPGVQIHSYGRDLAAALRGATETAAGGPLVVAGSLYLVGDVLRLLKGNSAG